MPLGLLLDRKVPAEEALGRNGLFLDCRMLPGWILDCTVPIRIRKVPQG